VHSTSYSNDSFYFERNTHPSTRSPPGNGQRSHSLPFGSLTRLSIDSAEKPYPSLPAMEPTEYLVLLIDPNLDTHPELPTTPSSSSFQATTSTFANTNHNSETLSNASSQSLCSSTSTNSTATSQTSNGSSAHLSPLRKNQQRSPRSKSKSTGASASRSRSESRSSDGSSQLSSILQLAGLKGKDKELRKRREGSGHGQRKHS
jgi:hypothetical protein